MRLVYFPTRPANAYFVLWWHYFSTGRFDKTLHWAKDNIRAYVASRGPHSRHAGFLAWDYERLGLTMDADYGMADAMVYTPQPEDKFF